ncbi:MAG: agmatine deiminase family protein [Candidatus Binataceae bacterium]
MSLTSEHRALLGAYRMPAEWAPHLATYLIWPHNPDTWPGKFELIAAAYAEIVAALSQFEPVRLLVKEAGLFEQVRATIARASNPPRLDHIELIAIPTNDSWVRDTGPIFVNRIAAVDGPPQLVLNWRFNSWGEKWGAHDLDDAVPRRLAEHYGFTRIEPGIVLEGGSIDVNGAGALLTTESCLLNRNRNPRLERSEIEDYLRACLGVSNVLWLGDGIAGDDTDGHVDDLTRFVARDTAVTVVEDDPTDANYAALRDNLARLRSMRLEDGGALRIETLPMPPAVLDGDVRLPASYANFYIVNGGVLMPAFGCESDQVAREALVRLFPRRRVLDIPSRELVLGLGSVHCLSQQQPMPPSAQ